MTNIAFLRKDDLQYAQHKAQTIAILHDLIEGLENDRIPSLFVVGMERSGDDRIIHRVVHTKLQCDVLELVGLVKVCADEMSDSARRTLDL